MSDPTKRFSDRVDNYIKYRPSYPVEILEVLQSECGLNANSIVADIGSGTGILTKLFLENGNHVFAVEPNNEMREAAERQLTAFPNLSSIAGGAENSKLDADSVDFIISGQAFHWFDREKAKIEFSRILRPDGCLALIWNERRVNSSPFLSDYEAFLKKHATDYDVVNHVHIGEDIIREFFSPASLKVSSFPNHQHFDFEGIKGRCLSCSYIPNADSPNHNAMLEDLKHIYDKHQENDIATFEYDTIMYYGKFK
ncbi:class I SAM-dependent methyltransferase [Rubellicoccus peritrichatus]|uniref:Class I SAM-dependent methyltransferase n=1 Tax=Rubellicoccus peritrichatus TaxID=3080537 RepID=A0AAQ3LAA1_9BACT|nr:class I SAM-dependent methyltransferase [Puniceicoccus sp. CR14]WOO41711.1 class I SAM-dependent methyltransferase [Puniceicoccus sp. CR14]